jgi:deazaflavin-dependent oxidoreductase (nitroreductase family)
MARSFQHTFQHTFATQIGNALVSSLLRSGVKLSTMTLLTVPGRKSGLPHTTPVSIIELAGGRYVMSPYGQVDWVRNLRASGSATLTRGRDTREMIAVELTPDEAAPILRHALTIAPAFIRAYFDVTADSPIEEIVAEAPRHPVFELIGRSAGTASPPTEPAPGATRCPDVI